MPTNYTYKDNVDLAYSANKKRLRAEGAIVLDALMNEALHEMDRKFKQALARGEILEIEGSRAEMKSLLWTAAQKELGDGSQNQA